VVGGRLPGVKDLIGSTSAMNRDNMSNTEVSMKRIERSIEATVFNSRWLLAPVLLGLIVGLAALLYVFAVEDIAYIVTLRTAGHADAIVGMLNLVDLALTANLILIVICSSYQTFIARIDPAEHPSWPKGLIGIGFSDLKQKLLGSIAVIAAVGVLEWFVNVDTQVDSVKLAWVVAILLAFAVAMLILAIADRISRQRPGTGAG
jgi:uncharacterized protein (TIGR00645 family)